MPEYRIFSLNPEGKILGPSRIIKAESDQEAIQQSQQVPDGVIFEIWEGARRIASIGTDEKEQPRV
jgi:hypothetical protein